MPNSGAWKTMGREKLNRPLKRSLSERLSGTFSSTVLSTGKCWIVSKNSDSHRCGGRRPGGQSYFSKS